MTFIQKAQSDETICEHDYCSEVNVLVLSQFVALGETTYSMLNFLSPMLNFFITHPHLEDL